ncbi:MAG: SWF/SNF helicase family protein, partial [Anaerolineae bacterium]|nr:SWF/SNF helicase family protein [Anaerolineae bacterium]
RSRAATTEAKTEEEVDEIGRRTVLDLMNDESAEGIDVIPGSDTTDPDQKDSSTRRRLLEMARAADALQGEQDQKVIKLIEIVKKLLRDGYNPIIFCRFIPTVAYVTDALRDNLRNVTISGITGALPPAEREERVHQLAQSAKRVLVCTDCLSEGINLQDGFDSVIHYDLSWNPTRHEQREGRVDRYGQQKPNVKVMTYYGIDNQIDGIVLDVLLRKHRTIRNSLGISVPVPGNTEDIVEAIFEGLLLKEDRDFYQSTLPGFDEHIKPRQLELDNLWDKAAEREKRSRTMFAQQTIKVDEVADELAAAREAVGSGIDVAAFMKDAMQMHNGVVSQNGAVKFDLTEVPRGLRELIFRDSTQTEFAARFELPVKQGQEYLTRTHPIVESLAAYVMNTALDATEIEQGQPRARRAGAVRTSHVQRRTTLLLIRLRYHLITKAGSVERQLLAEDSLILGFEGSPENAVWIDPAQAEQLLKAEPDENIHPQESADYVRRVVDGFDHLAPKLNEIAEQRGAELLDAHRRVRAASRQRGVRYAVEPQLPPDVLGVYVFLPVMRR